MLRNYIASAFLGLLAVAANGQSVIGAPPKASDKELAPQKWGDTSEYRFAEVKSETISTFGLILDLPNPRRITNPDMEDEEEIDLSKAFKGSGHIAPLHMDEVGISTNALTTEFFGISETLLRPPDCTMAVGSDYVVLCVNDKIKITDKFGVTTFTADAPDFFNDPTGFYFDPKVVYDPWRLNWCMLWHKWNDTTQNSELVMVGSDDSNPNGTWFIHRFDSDFVIDAGKRAKADYFDLGYSSKCLTISGNWFNWDGTGFAATGVATFNPTQIYSSGSAGWIVLIGFSNANGTEAHTMRPAHMLNSFSGGWDQVLVNSARLGGNQITVWKYTDPLNTGGNLAITRSDITVNDYFVPKDATQQGSGSTLDTIDCRLMPVFMGGATSGVTTNSSLWTGLNTGNAATATITYARLLMLDPIAGTKPLDTNFTDGTNYYWFATPCATYDKNATWVFTRSGSAQFAEARYVTWDPVGGLGVSAQLKAGVSAYTGGRWGDYFGADLDWGDYYANNGTAGSQKMWFFGEYAAASGNWGTWVGCTRPIGSAAGFMSVSPAATQVISWYGGTNNPQTATYTVSNSGDVSFVYRLRSMPTWLDGSPSRDEVGTTPNSRTTEIGPNAVGVSLDWGIYTDTFQFENGYSGAQLSRTIEGHAGRAQRATAFTVELGQLNAGGLAGIGEQNDGLVLRVCKFIIPNQQVSPITVRFDTTIPGAGVASLSSMNYVFRSRMTIAGQFTQVLELWNWTTNSYDAQTNVTLLNTTFKDVSLVPTGNLNRFINANKQMRGRVRIKPSGPIANPNYCAEFDLNAWNAIP